MSMMLWLYIFMGVALALAAYLIVTSLRTSREEERALVLAQEREHTARLVAERARKQRAIWEAKLLEDQLLAARSDPRGVGDGLGPEDAPTVRTGRFRREAPVASTESR